MTIYPAIDILDGKCVRLYQGSFDKATVYSDDPLEMAKLWIDKGATFLHIVDLNGAQTGEPKNISIIGDILREVRIPVQVGGGLRTLDVMEDLLSKGAARVVLGTSLFTMPELVREASGRFAERIVAAVDARDGRVATHGWLKQTELEAVNVVKTLSALGIKLYLYTDIAVDGTRSGPNYDKIKSLLEETTVPLIVSGGVANLEDVRRVRAMEPLGVEGLIVGRALYDKAFSLEAALAVIAGLT